MTTDFKCRLASKAFSRIHFPCKKPRSGRLLVSLFFLTFFPVPRFPYEVSTPMASPSFSPATPLLEQAVDLNQSLMAFFSFTPTRPVKHYPLTFNATDSRDPNGTIVNYAWDFGDGKTNSTTTPIISHTYSSTATVTVTLTVTNQVGATASFGTNLTINSSNAFPTPSFTVLPSTPLVGDTVSFNGTGSWDPDIAGGIINYLWLFDDGTYSNAANVTLHSYSSPGLYQVTLMVTDNSGAVTSGTRAVYVLQSLTLTVSTDKTQGTAPLLVSLNAHASGGQGPYTFDWDFGDGSPAGAANPSSHNYTEPGIYHAKLGVADSAGHVSSRDVTITVIEGATGAGGPGGVGGQVAFAGPVPYLLNAIGFTAIGLILLLLVYAFVVRRARRKQTPAWAYIAPRTKKGLLLFRGAMS